MGRRRKSGNWNSAQSVLPVAQQDRGYTGNTASRIMTGTNEYQSPHKYKKVLCVCMGGILRSATAAVVLSQEPYNCNTRAAGVDEHIALVPVDQALVSWADEIVCMEKYMMIDIIERFKMTGQRMICLNIPDRYGYRDPELISLICAGYDRHLPKAPVPHDFDRDYIDDWGDQSDDPADKFDVDEWPPRTYQRNTAASTDRLPLTDAEFLAKYGKIESKKCTCVGFNVDPSCPLHEKPEKDERTLEQKVIEKWVTGKDAPAPVEPSVVEEKAAEATGTSVDSAVQTV